MNVYEDGSAICPRSFHVLIRGFHFQLVVICVFWVRNNTLLYGILFIDSIAAPPYPD